MKTYKDIVLGTGLIILSIFYLVNAQKINIFTGPGASEMNSRAFPEILGWIFLCLSTALTVRGFIGSRVLSGLKTSGVTNRLFSIKGIFVKYRKAFLTLFLLTVYVAGLGYAGFIIMTFLFLLSEMLVLCDKNRRAILFVFLSLFISCAIYFSFTELFHVMLPFGSLWE